MRQRSDTVTICNS